MKKTIYKNVNKHFNDAMYWIENKKSISHATESINIILDNLLSLTMFLDSSTAFHDYVMRKVCEIYIADGRPDAMLNYHYMKGFYTGK